jgi:hypothetical protein
MKGDVDVTAAPTLPVNVCVAGDIDWPGPGPGGGVGLEVVKGTAVDQSPAPAALTARMYRT